LQKKYCKGMGGREAADQSLVLLRTNYSGIIGSVYMALAGLFTRVSGTSLGSSCRSLLPIPLPCWPVSFPVPTLDR
jgi:hypothetical protein